MRLQKKSQTYSNLQTEFDEIHWLNGILEWHCHHMPKAGQLLACEELRTREIERVHFFLVSISDQIAQIPGALGPIKLKSSKSLFWLALGAGIDPNFRKSQGMAQVKKVTRL